MDDSIEPPELSKDDSSYSSFFKTHTSLKDVNDNATDLGRGLENQHPESTKHEPEADKDADQTHTETKKDSEVSTTKQPEEKETSKQRGTSYQQEEPSEAQRNDTEGKNVTNDDNDNIDIVSTASNPNSDDITAPLSTSGDNATPKFLSKTTDTDTVQKNQNENDTKAKHIGNMPSDNDNIKTENMGETHLHDNSDSVKQDHVMATIPEYVLDQKVKELTQAVVNEALNEESESMLEVRDEAPSKNDNDNRAFRENTSSDEDQMPTDMGIGENETDFIRGMSQSRARLEKDKLEQSNDIDNVASATGTKSEAMKKEENINGTEKEMDLNTKYETNPLQSPVHVGEMENEVRENWINLTDTDCGQPMDEPKNENEPHSAIDHHNTHASEEKVEKSTGDNIYFTGRLPTLMHMKEKSSTLPVDDTTVTDEAGKSDNSELSFDEGTHNDNTQRHKPEGQRVPTASKRVKELLDKINEPTETPERHYRDNQMTPRTMLRRAKSATSIYTAKTEIIDEIDEDAIAKTSAANQIQGTSMTVGDINTYTTKVMSTSTTNKDQNTRFDNLTHMQNISKYVKGKMDSDLESKEYYNQTHASDKRNNKKSPNETLVSQQKSGEITKQTFSPTVEETNEKHNTFEHHNGNIETDSESNHLQRSRSGTPKSYHSGRIRRSTSENELKAIITSAKQARGETTEDSESNEHDGSYSEFANLSLIGGSKPVSKKTKSVGARMLGQESNGQMGEKEDGTNSLICSRCLQSDRNIHEAGFCTTCQNYLCGTCISVHLMDKATMNHQIAPSYCKNELVKNKYVQATSYCNDCNTFLCMKCTIQHNQLRDNRRHRIIQSSFVSKPSTKKKDNHDFLNELQDKLNDDLSDSWSHDGTDKKRRKLLTDVNDKNPYRYRFSHVPGFIYPGSKKKLETSYTKRPKWPHSSLPALPYLVQPKLIKEGFSFTKHLGLVNSRKKEVSYMADRLKVLQKRYNVRPKYEKLYTRKDQTNSLSTLGSVNESISLPDIDGGKSHKSGVRTVKQINEAPKGAQGLRKCDFVEAHHLTLPSVTGEKSTAILAMTILMNGSLAVIDKNNNNIKIYNKMFNCRAALQFHNRLVDICASNICPTDLYAATPKHVYEISNEDGLDVRRKIKVEIKRIEGLTNWKYGIAVISKKTNITWELRLMDYRGNQKSRLEIFNPLTCEIATSQLCHVTSSKGGKRVSISDTQNFCVITVDVTSRDVQHETYLGAGNEPAYLTADSSANHNLYVASADKVYQISKKGKIKGVVVDKTADNDYVGCIVCNTPRDRLYVQTGADVVSVYQLI